MELIGVGVQPFQKTGSLRGLKCSLGASLLIPKSQVFQCLPVQAWKSVYKHTGNPAVQDSDTDEISCLCSLANLESRESESLPWATTLPMVCFGCQRVLSQQQSLIFPCQFPHLQKHFLAVMSSAHSPESETNGNTEIFGQSKDKICSLHGSKDKVRGI